MEFYEAFPAVSEVSFPKMLAISQINTLLYGIFKNGVLALKNYAC